MEKKNNMRAYIKRQGYYYNAILGAILRHFFILKIPPQVKRTRVTEERLKHKVHITLHLRLRNSRFPVSMSKLQVPQSLELNDMLEKYQRPVGDKFETNLKQV